ncbi:hypothetical protein IIA79_02510 [bacterium]|nr:hypothetical protein [bacterium]
MSETTQSRAPFQEFSDELLELESLIDTYSLHDLLDGLAAIARGKGEHLRANWQDEIAARNWEAAAAQIEGLTYHDVVGLL